VHFTRHGSRGLALLRTTDESQLFLDRDRPLISTEFVKRSFIILPGNLEWTTS